MINFLAAAVVEITECCSRTRHVRQFFFPNFDICRRKYCDVISGVGKDWVGMDVRVKFSDSALNSCRIIRLVTGRSRFAHLHVVFNSSLQPTGSS